jgi:hypothetical protein
VKRGVELYESLTQQDGATKHDQACGTSAWDDAEPERVRVPGLSVECRRFARHARRAGVPVDVREKDMAPIKPNNTFLPPHAARVPLAGWARASPASPGRLLDRDGLLRPSRAALAPAGPRRRAGAPSRVIASSSRTSPPRPRASSSCSCTAGPSPVDTFDYKPELYALDGKTIQVKTFGRGGKKNEGRVVGPKWKFKQYGQCGKYVSDLFPHVGQCVDDIAFIHSMTADSPIHGSAMLDDEQRPILSGTPCLGSWVNYGLGSVNENLPGLRRDARPDRRARSAAPRTGRAATCPPATRASILRSPATRSSTSSRPRHDAPMQRRLLDTLGDYNREHLAARADNSELAARIASYEMAYKHAAARARGGRRRQRVGDDQPLYGMDETKTEDFGRAACWPGGSSSAACGSCSSTPAAPTTTTTGTPTATWRRTTTTTPAGPTSRSPAAEGPQAARPARQHAGRLGRRVRPPADGRVRRRHRPRPQRLRVHHVDGRRRHQGRRQRRRDRRDSAASRPRPLHVSNLHATSCNSSASTPNRLSYFYSGLDQKLVGVEGADRSSRSSDAAGRADALH